MKKLLVSIIAIASTVVSVAYGAEDCGCKNCGCKPKKVRVIHITAGDPQTMYNDAMYTTTVIDGDGSYQTYDEPTQLTVAPAHSDYDRGYEYERGPRYRGNWYVGGRLGLHLASWKNKYHGSPSNYKFDNGEDHDDYTFEPVFGGNIFAGYRFTPNWRTDLEFGYMTQFSDSDNGFTFKLSTPYLMGNAYYDFNGGFYLGAGLGLAFPRATLDWEYFEKDNASKTKLSFAGALMAGYSYYMTDSLALDFRYRLAGFVGPKLTRNVMAGVKDENDVELRTLETKVGFVIDNSFSIGLRYEF